MLLIDPRHRAVTTKAKAKAKVNHPGVEDTSELLASQGRECVSIATSLDIIDGIARRGEDSKGMGHHSPNHQWDSHRCLSFLLTPTWVKETGVSPRVLHKHSLICRRVA